MTYDHHTEWQKVSRMVNDLCRDTRQIRIWTERLHALREAIHKYYVQLPRTPGMDIRPELIEFALMDECRALGESPQWRTITSDDFLALLPDLSKRWFDEKTEILRSELRSDLKNVQCNVSSEVQEPFDLAVAVWVCLFCRSHLRYPAVLVHACLYRDIIHHNRGTSTVSYAYTASHLDMSDHDISRGHCNVQRRQEVANDPKSRCKVLERLSRIVSALGLDPARALAKDLDACPERLRCADCIKHDAKPKNYVFGWEAAVSVQ